MLHSTLGSLALFRGCSGRQLRRIGRLGTMLEVGPGRVLCDEGAIGAEFFVINCAHPTHFADALPEGESRKRIRGLRANASTLSHAELDDAEELDSGDPDDLAQRYVALRTGLPELEVLGGCCGTDIRHVTAICDAWLAA